MKYKIYNSHISIGNFLTAKQKAVISQKTKVPNNKC